MSTSSGSTTTSSRQNIAQILINKNSWMTLFCCVAAISIAGLVYLGTVTYTGAPPVANFVSSTGKTVISGELIKRGEEVFHLRGLMAYGSFWGDGATRGPDFTADALHRTVLAMRTFYENETSQSHTVKQFDRDAITVRVKRELHTNTFDENAGVVHINAAQAFAFQELNVHYTRMFTDPDYPELFQTGYITDPEAIRH